ncbi:hypothetical protein ACFWMS_07400 [Peribacillus butanolivorans]|uniref:hypothetical protein n=1 Tax=Peribacillus butanolivorans TaxID=421767 RepID=UPI0036525C5B
MIPDIILAEVAELNESSEIDWVEAHDRLIIINKSPFDLQNQVDWWKKNYEIRMAFSSIEKEIKELKRNNSKINKRLLTWTKIAKLANCDRNTLRHHKRINWTQERFDFLKDIINNSNVVQKKNNNQELSEEKIKIKNLEEKVNKARNETAKWMDSYHLIRKELKIIQNVLKHKENDIFTKNRKIKELVEQMKLKGEHL